MNDSNRHDGLLKKVNILFGWQINKSWIHRGFAKVAAPAAKTKSDKLVTIVTKR